MSFHARFHVLTRLEEISYQILWITMVTCNWVQSSESSPTVITLNESQIKGIRQLLCFRVFSSTVRLINRRIFSIWSLANDVNLLIKRERVYTFFNPSHKKLLRIFPQSSASVFFVYNSIKMMIKFPLPLLSNVNSEHWKVENHL